MTRAGLAKAIGLAIVGVILSACDRSGEAHDHASHDHAAHDHTAHDHTSHHQAAGQTAAQVPVSSALSVVDAHMPEVIPGQTRGVIYLALHNGTAQDRHILYLQTPIAGTAEVHTHVHEDGVMRMRQVTHPVVAAGSVLAFDPGGYHIMLIDIAERPAVGSHFPLTIEFDGGERLTVTVAVRSR